MKRGSAVAEPPKREHRPSGGREATTVTPQQGSPTPRPADADSPSSLSIAEAAGLFEVSSATLRRLISAGQLQAWQVGGVRGREWRVSPDALVEAGYSRRGIDLTETGAVPTEVRRLMEALAAERVRSARLDSELGYALLTVGRLRGRLRDAGIDPDELFGADLDAGHEEGQ